MKRHEFFLKVALYLVGSLFGITLVTGQTTELTGIWSGKVQVTDQLALQFVYTLKKTDGGNLSATLGIVEQKVANIPMEVVSLNNDTLTIESPERGLKYKGVYRPAQQKVEGAYEQGGKSFPLILSRTEAMPGKINRPQTPVRPFPYSEEEVVIANADEGIQISGTITFPENGSNLPAVILIAGSGRNDRNGTPMGHFLLLSDYLTRKGYVVLRTDKRGVGGSTGNYALATTKDFASDIGAAIDYLKTRKEVNPRNIGLIGHSEGTLIAPMLAAERKDIRFMVLLGAVGIPGDELLLLQIRAMAGVTGMAASDIDKRVELNRAYYSLMKEDQTDEQLKDRLKSVNPELTEKETQSLLKPWIRSFIKCDPSAYLVKTKCPVLALSGEKDLQCPPEINFKAMEKSLKEGGNRHFSLEIVPSLNHLLQTATTGSPLEYDQISEIISPLVLERIAEWIAIQNGKR